MRVGLWRLKQRISLAVVTYGLLRNPVSQTLCIPCRKISAENGIFKCNEGESFDCVWFNEKTAVFSTKYCSSSISHVDNSVRLLIYFHILLCTNEAIPTQLHCFGYNDGPAIIAEDAPVHFVDTKPPHLLALPLLAAWSIFVIVFVLHNTALIMLPLAHAPSVRQLVCLPVVICPHNNRQIWSFRCYCELHVAS